MDSTLMIIIINEDFHERACIAEIIDLYSLAGKFGEH